MSTHWRRRPLGYTRFEVLVGAVVAVSFCVGMYLVYLEVGLLKAAIRFLMNH